MYELGLCRVAIHPALTATVAVVVIRTGIA